jgi:hypothetical protein
MTTDGDYWVTADSRGVVGRQQAGQPVRGGRIARRDLPDFAHAFEVANVEGVQAHELDRNTRAPLLRARG